MIKMEDKEKQEPSKEPQSPETPKDLPFKECPFEKGATKENWKHLSSSMSELPKPILLYLIYMVVYVYCTCILEC